MAGFLTRPAPKREVAREDAVVWREPDCDTCFTVFGDYHCRKESFGKLEIVEEFHLDGSHVCHIIAPHYVYARLESMQVMATLDEAQFADPFGDAVKVLAHLGFLYVDGVIANGE
jgi:hypothetical protein